MTDLTDDMVERVAKALFAHVGVGAPDRLDWRWENWLEDADRDNYREKARQALEAGLGGRVVVDLPEPDQRGSTVEWHNSEHGRRWLTTASLEGAAPVVSDRGVVMPADAAEARALRLLAAAREARRLAEESE